MDSLEEDPLQNFFNIILQSTIVEKKMRLPSKFLGRYGDELSDVATLTLPNGRTWEIGLTKINENVWFDKGWSEFAECHSIQHGHFLLFKYVGNSSFNVVICDLTACEIQYPSDGESFGEEPTKIKQKDMESDSVEMLLVNMHTSEKEENCGEKELMNNYEKGVEMIDSEKLPYKSSKTLQKCKKALNATEMLQPKNPFFTVVIQEYNLKSKTAYVPVEFTTNYLGGADGFIRIFVSDGREWLVTACPRRGKGGLNLSKGWGEFCNDNNVVLGDVCVFELILSSDATLKASIFRRPSVNKQCRMKMKVKSSNTGFDEYELPIGHEDAQNLTRENLSNMFVNASQESKRATQFAEMFKPKNPYFMATLNACNVNQEDLVRNLFI